MSSAVLLPAFSTTIFNPREIYAERVGSRRLAYLDHNVWIELRDQKTDAARACREACERAFSAGQVLFPLTHAAITECLDIEDVPSRTRHAELLDHLSAGVTYRENSLLMAMEARNVHHWLFHDTAHELAREEVLTSVPDHLGNRRLSFPAGLTAEKVAAFLQNVRSDPNYRSVLRMALSRDWKPGHAAMRSRYIELSLTSQAEWSEIAPRQKDAAFSRALLRERIALLKLHILPTSREALLAEGGAEGMLKAVIELKQRRGEGGKQRIKEIFSRAPILDLHARLLAAHTLETRRNPQEQDFFDFEHCILPPLYADAFVTLDRRLFATLKSTNGARATLMSTLDALTMWLKDNTEKAST